MTAIRDRRILAPALPPTRMSEEEFVRWATSETRAEWVNGEVIIMSPVNPEHARINRWMAHLLELFVDRSGLGMIVGPDVMVRLAEQHRRRAPDLVFVAKEHADRVTRTHVEGVPDLVVEIVSPDSEARDWREKYLEYESAGVREYWVIDPPSQHIEAYALRDMHYQRIAETEGRISSSVLPGFFVKAAWFWQEPLPKIHDIARELGIA